MSDSTRVFNIRLARRCPSIQALQAFRQDAPRLLDDMHQKSSGALLGIHATSIRGTDGAEFARAQDSSSSELAAHADAANRLSS
jgi:hypothetical protein